MGTSVVSSCRSADVGVANYLPLVGFRRYNGYLCTVRQDGDGVLRFPDPKTPSMFWMGFKSRDAGLRFRNWAVRAGFGARTVSWVAILTSCSDTGNFLVLRRIWGMRIEMY